MNHFGITCNAQNLNKMMVYLESEVCFNMLINFFCILFFFSGAKSNQPMKHRRFSLVTVCIIHSTDVFDPWKHVFSCWTHDVVCQLSSSYFFSRYVGDTT